MACDNCGADNAVVHLTQIVNNQMSTYHLCQKCAAEKGVDTSVPSSNTPLTDFLAQMGEGRSEGGPGTKEACSFCGLTFDDFKSSGRLGCPHCYATFDTQLRSLLRRIHGGTQHVGKVYLPPDPAVADRQLRIAGLMRKLQRAVDLEDFERAAELRDEIKALEAAR